MDGHPDAYLVCLETRFVDESTMTTKIQFKGTRALPVPNEFYFMKPALVDNMNLDRFSESEVAVLRQQEESLMSQNKPIDIEFVGVMTMIFNESVFRTDNEAFFLSEDLIPLVGGIVFDYELKSFKEAIIVPVL
jgi:hypothetical protein